MKIGSIIYTVQFLFKPLLFIETQLMFDTRFKHFIHVRNDLL
jgi:hypothetical protein